MKLIYATKGTGCFFEGIFITLKNTIVLLAKVTLFLFTEDTKSKKRKRHSKLHIYSIFVLTCNVLAFLLNRLFGFAAFLLYL